MINPKRGHSCRRFPQPLSVIRYLLSGDRKIDERQPDRRQQRHDADDDKDIEELIGTVTVLQRDLRLFRMIPDGTLISDLTRVRVDCR